MKKFIYHFIIILCFFLSACAASPGKPSPGKPAPGKKPGWFYKPCIDGKLGGVGIAGKHIRGIYAQKELAIQRAIDDIAKQMGVKVQNFSTSVSKGNRDKVNTKIDTYSIQTVEGKTVSATIMEIWEEPKSGKMYVWMVVR